MGSEMCIRDRRKFMMKTLREFGVGKQSMEDHILEELKFITEYIEASVRINYFFWLIFQEAYFNDIVIRSGLSHSILKQMHK